MIYLNIIYIFLLSVLSESSGIIYKLNESEYEQLPTLYELENYGACMENPGAVYCVASLELHGEPDSQIYNLIKEYSQHTIKHFNYSKIDRGVCITSTCAKYMRNGTHNDEDLEMIVEECLNDKIKEKYDLNGRIYRLNCERYKEESETDGFDKVVAAVIICLCAAVLIGSYYDSTFCRDRADDEIGRGGQFLLCFSVFRNMKKLTSEEKGDERLSELKGVHGIRAISEFAVIYGHTYFLLLMFVSDPHSYEKAYESFWGRIRFSSSSVVQIFFVISGFIQAYFMQIYAETHHLSWKHVPKFIFHRWCRLVPPIAFVVAFVATWSRFLGSGPLWKYFVTNLTSAQCRKYFWTHIFLYNNYMADDTSCVLQTWHVSADMQLFVFGLIVHFAIRNRTLRFKIWTMAVLLLVGIMGPILHVWLQDLDAFAMLTPELYRAMYDENFRRYHIYGHNNTACFIIGMASGYIIYYLKQKKLEYPKFKLGNIISWLLIPSLLAVFYLSGLFFNDGERPPMALRILYAATHRIVIGVITSVWLVGIVLKFNGCSKTIMEWEGWVLPSKLSYCVYLVHIDVLTYLVAIRTQLTPVSFLNTFFMYIGVVVFCYILALILHLLVEAPSYSLLKVFKGSRSSQRIDTGDKKNVKRMHGTASKSQETKKIK